MKSRVLIDYLSFTYRPSMEDSLTLVRYLDKRYKLEQGQLSNTYEFRKALTEKGKIKFDNNIRGWVTEIFGKLQKLIFSLEYKERNYGYSGYTDSLDLFRDGQRCGLIAWGGKNASVLVSLSGAGMAETDYKKFHSLLTSLVYCKITRIDFAYDSYDGFYNFDWCREQYISGGFNAGGRNPVCHEFSSKGVLDDDGSIRFDGGRTFAVGNRNNGKYFRGYEKGKQLLGQGVNVCKESLNWFRLEVEIHATKRDIPFDCLLDPARFMAGTYPVLAFVSQEKESIKTKSKVAKIALQTLIGSARLSYGNLVAFLKNQLDWPDQKIIEHLLNQNPRPPKRLARLVNLNVA